MKAIVLTEYGSSDVLQLREVATPTPKDDEVLIKVHAASVNDWDWCLMRGTPFADIENLCVADIRAVLADPVAWSKAHGGSGH